jgi:hypothetical protein
MSKPGMLRKMVTLPPVEMATKTRTVPPTRPIIVAISISAVPEHYRYNIRHMDKKWL